MPDPRQQQFIQDLLDLISNPVYRSRHQERVWRGNGYRIIREVTDETGIGPDNNTEGQVRHDKTLLDCHHISDQQVGGQCHFCDALVCRHCIHLCFSCGLATCPRCSTIANFDGRDRLYCRHCATEIARSLRLRSIRRKIVSFFLG